MEHQDWTVDTSYELLVYKLIMWPLGIWPLNKGELFSEIRLLLAASTQAATFICLTLEILNNCRGVEIVLDLFVLSVFSLLACVKGLIVHHHIHNMSENVRSAIADWSLLSQTDNSQNKELMTKYARIGKLVCFSLMIPASGGTLSWIILALPLPMFLPANSSNVIKNFPLQTACTFDPITTSKFYYLIFGLQMYQLVTTCLGNCGNDVFFFGMSMHTCGQLEILQNDLTDIEIEKEESNNWRKLKGMVKRHVHLIELVDKLEGTFNMIILAQLIMSAVLICIMGESICKRYYRQLIIDISFGIGLQVIIALKTGDMFAAVKANIVLSSLMSQLFLYSYGGDCLTTQNASVALAVDKSPWYKASAVTMKNVAFIMMRANKPIYVTAGKFFDMTLSTFMEILKASVSYMSVLRIAIDV
ncbi:odorant receptor 85f isoform X1 [Fopius arisanus]|uniref:Odorant receptor n=1 Tax=Fopius arisanus TaxID=64838 RepID=A0A9R1TUS2_9HYME|nr:PREDICTED: odorant receptor 85f-like isoform X1 [Fopius arisanus]